MQHPARCSAVLWGRSAVGAADAWVAQPWFRAGGRAYAAGMVWVWGAWWGAVMVCVGSRVGQ
mgnify:CR=1 FL=1